jgi:integrase
MASVKYRLNRPKEKTGELKKVPVSILISYYHAGVAVEDLSTNQKTIPAKWENNRIKGDKGLLINKYLNELETNLLNAHLVHRVSGPALEKIIRRIIKSERVHDQIEEDTQKKTSLFTVGRFIVQCKREKDPKTVGRYKVLWRALGRFLKGSRLDFSKIDHEFTDRFKNYLYDTSNPYYIGHCLQFDSAAGCYIVVPGSDGLPIGLFDEVVFKYFINLKTVCRWIENRGYQVHQAYKEWDFKSREYEPITFSHDELHAMEALEFTETYKPKKNYNINLNVVRDYTSVECRIGQRISDIKRLDKVNFEDTTLNLTQKKGNRVKENRVRFNLVGYAAPALMILQKYNYKMPYISEADLNLGIKELARRAGITQDMYIERWAGNRKVRISGKKYEFVSSHTGKKSFITILAGKGVPLAMISEITGTTQRTIERHYLGKIDNNVVDSYLKKVEDNTSIMRKTS